MAKAAFSISFVFLCCLLSWQSVNATTESRHLREYIHSRRSVRPLSDRTWSAERLNEVYLASQDGLMEADKIEALPGQPKGVDFEQYGGYVTVNPKAGRALFYYFVESPNNATSKPLVLWLNGGPGCSSLGGGAMVELGPFRVNPDGKTLRSNVYSWNMVANMLFLESPAGVGFSYSNTTSDYDHTGDKQTTEETYIFLINWLERFPQYKGREFYITGESYAGHYVPELASTILAHNSENGTIINLKGIAIGNAYVDNNINLKGTYEYYWTHALNSDETHTAIVSKCNFTSGDYSQDCIDARNKADEEIGNIDVYGIYGPLCGENRVTSSTDGNDPCSMNYATEYLNLPEVQLAMHANVTKVSYPWADCSDPLFYNWTDSPVTMHPTLQDLTNSGIRFLIYSGDQDAIVPVTATQYSINMLDLSVKDSWRAWYYNGEVGGFVVNYNGLTFATVRGAGHMVPSYQPERALILFISFLEGKLLPSK